MTWLKFHRWKPRCQDLNPGLHLPPDSGFGTFFLFPIISQTPVFKAFRNMESTSAIRMITVPRVTLPLGCNWVCKCGPIFLSCPSGNYTTQPNHGASLTAQVTVDLFHMSWGLLLASLLSFCVNLRKLHFSLLQFSYLQYWNNEASKILHRDIFFHWQFQMEKSM